MSDLTIIFLTANKQPKEWTAYHKQVLLDAVGDIPLITVSREPLDFGHNILDTGEKSHINMYRQMLEAAKLADTPYIAAAEDDCLYTEAHFREFRPPLDTFSYNWARWSLYTWVKPAQYNYKNRISNAGFIGPRKLFIEAWEERFAKYPGNTMPPERVSEVGRNNQEGWMGVTKRKCVPFYSTVPIIHFNHPAGTDSVGFKKRMGALKAFDIPYWGKAEELVNKYR